MATQAATLSNTITAIQTLAYESGYAQKAIQILLGAGKEDLSNPAVIEQLKQAYQFFEAMHNCSTFTDPTTGKVMDFSIYGAGGILGDQSSKFQSLVNKALSSINTITMPTPLGTNATVYDKTTGEPATLLDLVANTSDKFTFTFKEKNGTSYELHAVNWCDSTSFYGFTSSFFNAGQDVHTPFQGQGGSADKTFHTNYGQVQVHDHQAGVYYGGNNTYTCTADIGALKDCATIGTSDTEAADANINALNAFLNSEI